MVHAHRNCADTRACCHNCGLLPSRSLLGAMALCVAVIMFRDQELAVAMADRCVVRPEPNTWSRGRCAAGERSRSIVALPLDDTMSICLSSRQGCGRFAGNFFPISYH